MLNIETSFIHQAGNKRKTYFIRVGRLESASRCFTILDQVWGVMKFKYTRIHDQQKQFIDAIAHEELKLLPSPISPTTTNNKTKSIESYTHEQLSENYSHSPSINIYCYP